MPNNYKAFETERLILRPTRIGDAGFMYELLNSPNWLKYIGDRKVYSIEAAQKYITEKILPQLERLGYANYTVIRKLDNNKIGTCGLYDREGMEGIDIGFAFLPEYEKQGYAFEAANKVKQVGIEEFNIIEIKAITSKKNLASQKLLKKLGLTFAKHFTLPDDDEELLLYHFVLD
jgi:ribosomal-protein-alanine N-acetyltransferase